MKQRLQHLARLLSALLGTPRLNDLRDRHPCRHGLAAVLSVIVSLEVVPRLLGYSEAKFENLPVTVLIGLAFTITLLPPMTLALEIVLWVPSMTGWATGTSSLAWGSRLRRAIRSHSRWQW